MSRISLPRRRTLQRILATVAAAVLPRIAVAGPAGASCAEAARAAAHDIASWPRGFAGVTLRQQSMIHVRAAIQAALSGNEGLCWQQLALSGHQPNPALAASAR
jgi:hypothetical protein